MFEVGRICVKTAGRESGRYCVIVKKIDENMYMVTGPKVLTKVRRRQCNMDHLEPLTEKLEISADASDSVVLKAFTDAQLKAMGLKRPTAAAIKAWEAQRSEKEKKRSEREARERAEREKQEKEAKKKEEKAKKEKKAEPKKEKAKAEAKKEEKK